MRYFLDTEFNEEVNPVEMISIGVVAEDGREFYAIDQRYHDWSSRWETTNSWVQHNVRPIMLLEGMQPVFGNKEIIRDALQAFVGLDQAPEFWAYFGDYDWFLVCRLFDKFEKMPKNWYPICYDLKQFSKHVGVKTPPKFTPEHNALVDARWTKHAFETVLKGPRELKWP